MSETYTDVIARELGVRSQQVAAAAKLLQEGATVPFIARYRKELTGQLDEVAITAVRDRWTQLADLDGRRQSILKSLTERELLTDELAAKIGQVETMSALEDLYLPYRPKRRTRAMMAREKGLEPLAKTLFEQAASTDPETQAVVFVAEEKGVNSVEEALAGARDILAEWISEDAEARRQVRHLYETESIVESRVGHGAEEKGAKFKNYFDWKEPLAKAPGHRILAMFRGEKEEVLLLRVHPDEEMAVGLVTRRFVRGSGKAAGQVRLAAEDAYRRLLKPSMEAETRMTFRAKAGEEAIRVFAENVRELLMASPLGEKRVMAIDPGFRTGCKVACLDSQGKLLLPTTIYPTQSVRQASEAEAVVRKLVETFKIEAIAIGNGTAGRETETFIRGLGLPSHILITMVNESGASVYSASEAAREEFPDHDLTVRGSVSIGRRLLDPLAELVKIDPKSIGVGQYQHDVDQTRLKQTLDDVVSSCVNSVGVELNTASKQLLSYVSGLGPVLAGNILECRNANGPFKRRADLKNVPRLGPKAFEQAAGFLRIRDAKNPLDASAVHPESYAIVTRMAKDQQCTVAALMSDAARRDAIQLDRYVTETVGLPTLRDILAELAKPGRDPRQKFEAFSFAEGVHSLADLLPGMKLPGIVTNVTKFGAFVDIGVHQDGLVHISELADTFVKDPGDVVKVQQKVQVTVMEVDVPRKRIALSMKKTPGARSEGSASGTGSSRPAPRTPSARPVSSGFKSNAFDGL